MQKKYIFRLSAKERQVLREVVKKFKGSSQKVRRAQILLKADVAGLAWTDQQSPTHSTVVAKPWRMFGSVSLSSLAETRYHRSRAMSQRPDSESAVWPNVVDGIFYLDQQRFVSDHPTEKAAR